MQYTQSHSYWQSYVSAPQLKITFLLVTVYLHVLLHCVLCYIELPNVQQKSMIAVHPPVSFSLNNV